MGSSSPALSEVTKTYVDNADSEEFAGLGVYEEQYVIVFLLIS